MMAVGDIYDGECRQKKEERNIIQYPLIVEQTLERIFYKTFFLCFGSHDDL